MSIHLPKVLIISVQFSTHATFYGQLESGEILLNCQGFPDNNGDICLMQVHPSKGFGNRPLAEVEKAWSTGNVKLIEVELSGLENECIESILPKGDIRWFIEKNV